MQTRRRRYPPLTLKDVFAAVGVIAIAVALLYPAVQAFAWGLRNPLLALVILVLLGLGAMAIKALATKPPESIEL